MDISIFSRRKNIIFQQDGSQGHTTRSTMTQLEDQDGRVWKKGVCPQNSSDFNLINDLWSIPKESAHHEPFPKTRPECPARFEEKWNSLPVELLQNLAQRRNTRVEEMINNAGRHSLY